MGGGHCGTYANLLHHRPAHQAKADLEEEPDEEYTNKILAGGKRNFIWLLIIIMAVFIDPNKFHWVPGITYDGQQFSFVRELIMFAVAFLSYRLASKDALAGNGLAFEPAIREVAFIFIGYFGTTMPAFELVGDFAGRRPGPSLLRTTPCSGAPACCRAFWTMPLPI